MKKYIIAALFIIMTVSVARAETCIFWVRTISKDIPIESEWDVVKSFNNFDSCQAYLKGFEQYRKDQRRPTASPDGNVSFYNICLPSSIDPRKQKSVKEYICESSGSNAHDKFHNADECEKTCGKQERHNRYYCVIDGDYASRIEVSEKEYLVGRDPAG